MKAEREGPITKGARMVENSSGNTALGLALMEAVARVSAFEDD